MTSRPLNGKVIPVLAIAVTAALAAAGAFSASQYAQGNIEARVSATERGIDGLAPVIRSIDQRLARLEGYARARRRAERER